MDILDNISCDKALDQFIQFIKNESSLNQDKFKSFDRKDKRLDHFYFHVLGIQKYKELAYTVKIILTLRHGPAAVEKGLSVGKSIFNVNMISLSVKPHIIFKLVGSSLSHVILHIQNIRTA